MLHDTTAKHARKKDSATVDYRHAESLKRVCTVPTLPRATLGAHGNGGTLA